MRNPGKLVIVLMIAVALGAALLSLWHHRASGRKSLDFWGTETALLIARAPRVDAILLEPADADRAPDVAAKPLGGQGGESIQRLGVGGRFYVVKDTRDASQARGVSNIRRALVLDVTYEWDQHASPAKPTWQYAFEFRDGDRSAMVFFDFDGREVGSNTSSNTAILDPAAAADWRNFFEEQFEKPPANSPSTK